MYLITFRSSDRPGLPVQQASNWSLHYIRLGIYMSTYMYIYMYIYTHTHIKHLIAKYVIRIWIPQIHWCKSTISTFIVFYIIMQAICMCNGLLVGYGLSKYVKWRVLSNALKLHTFTHTFIYISMCILVVVCHTW